MNKLAISWVLGMSIGVGYATTIAIGGKGYTDGPSSGYASVFTYESLPGSTEETGPDALYHHVISQKTDSTGHGSEHFPVYWIYEASVEGTQSGRASATINKTSGKLRVGAVGPDRVMDGEWPIADSWSGAHASIVESFRVLRTGGGAAVNVPVKVRLDLHGDLYGGPYQRKFYEENGEPVYPLEPLPHHSIAGAEITSHLTHRTSATTVENLVMPKIEIERFGPLQTLEFSVPYEYTFNVTHYEELLPRQWDFVLHLSLGAYAYNKAISALINTATVSIELPDGYALASASGLFLTDPTSTLGEITADFSIPGSGPASGVPDHGATIALLGLAFGTLGLARRSEN